jgi:hypothetical protein
LEPYLPAAANYGECNLYLQSDRYTFLENSPERKYDAPVRSEACCRGMKARIRPENPSKMDEKTLKAVRKAIAEVVEPPGDSSGQTRS